MVRPSETKPPVFLVPQHLLEDPLTNILDLYDWNAVHNAAAILFRYLEEDGTVKTITWSVANEATHRASDFFSSLAKPVLSCGDPRPVLAIFASVGTYQAHTLYNTVSHSRYHRSDHLLLFNSRCSSCWLCYLPHLPQKLARGGGQSSDTHQDTGTPHKPGIRNSGRRT